MTTADGGVIVGVKEALMGPGVLSRVQAVLSLVRQGHAGGAAQQGRAGSHGADHLGGEGGRLLTRSGGVGLRGLQERRHSADGGGLRGRDKRLEGAG